jgi:hypothetical protein
VTSGRPAGCRACEQLAYAARHEPNLVDDDAVRLWRCTGCGTSWNETERAVVPVTDEDADALHPTWRDRERWIRTTSLHALLVTHRQSQVHPGLLRTALLHHDVLAPRDRAQGGATVAVYSGAQSHTVDAEPSDALRLRALAWVLRRGAVDRLVLDPRTPWALELSGEPMKRLRYAARSVSTWSSRRRGDELRFSFPMGPSDPFTAAVDPTRIDVVHGMPPLPLPPCGDPYAGREVVDEVLSAAVVAYLSYGRTPFPWPDEDAVASQNPGRDVSDLVARARAIDGEMTDYEVDWVRNGYQGGCAEAAATLRARHPELGPEALAALDWAFSYRWR